MKYLYYPGCSLEGTATEYNLSTRALMQAIGAELTELTDWVCCGASAAEPVSYLLSLVLPSINLAIAEQTDEAQEILVPCSACYLNLKRAEEKIRKSPDLLREINTVLAEKNLHLRGVVKVRHLLDVISQDIGAEIIQQHLKQSLSGLRIAPYYGCQCLRPYVIFDDPETPRSMEPVLRATGAEIYPWHMGGKCCGASHMNTKPDAGMALVHALLQDARDADAIVTVCPMCQMNLEAYQKRISAIYQTHFDIAILYLPQLLGLAVGLSEAEVHLNLNLSVSHTFQYKIDR